MKLTKLLLAGTSVFTCILQSGEEVKGPCHLDPLQCIGCYVQFLL